MDRTVTVSAKNVLLVLLAAVLLLAVTTAYLLGGRGDAARAAGTGDTGPTGQPAAGAAPGTVTMVGRGSAVAVPDRVAFTLSVGATRDDLTAALDDASRTMARVARALERHGVRTRDVQTTGLSMHPVYDYPAASSPVLRGYRVNQRASVVVPDLANAGAALSAAVAAGGNAVDLGGIQLRVGDTEAVLAAARADAVARATRKAEEYAAATGQSLGDVLRLEEVGARPDVTHDAALAGQAFRADDLADVPISAGREELVVRVQVVWALEEE